MSLEKHEVKSICPIGGRDLSTRLLLVGKTARSKALNSLQEPWWSTFGEERVHRAPEELVAIYTRVSSHEHPANLLWLARRLEYYQAGLCAQTDSWPSAERFQPLLQSETRSLEP